MKKENDKSFITPAALGVAAGTAGVLGGKHLGKGFYNSFLDKVKETKVGQGAHDEALKRMISPDIAVSRGKTKDWNKIMWNAISKDRFAEKFAPEDLEKLKNYKAAIEIGPKGANTLATTAHELGHAEHMAGRGSRLGRIVHNRITRLPGLGIGAGIAAGALMDEDSTGKAAAVGGLAGALQTAPELLREHTANQEAIKLLKKTGMKEDMIKKVKSSYSPQLKLRATQKLLPAVGLGVGSALLANAAKKSL